MQLFVPFTLTISLLSTFCLFCLIPSHSLVFRLFCERFDLTTGRNRLSEWRVICVYFGLMCYTVRPHLTPGSFFKAEAPEKIWNLFGGLRPPARQHQTITANSWDVKIYFWITIFFSNCGESLFEKSGAIAVSYCLSFVPQKDYFEHFYCAFSGNDVIRAPQCLCWDSIA